MNFSVKISSRGLGGSPRCAGWESLYVDARASLLLCGPPAGRGESDAQVRRWGPRPWKIQDSRVSNDPAGGRGTSYVQDRVVVTSVISTSSAAARVLAGPSACVAGIRSIIRACRTVPSRLLTSSTSVLPWSGIVGFLASSRVGCRPPEGQADHEEHQGGRDSAGRRGREGGTAREGR